MGTTEMDGLPLDIRWPSGPVPVSRIRVGAGLLAAATVPEQRVALLHDAALPLRWVQRACAALRPCVTLAVTPGEDGKTLAEVARLLSALAAAGLPRSGAVVALGGGATTDVAGFVAASYLRGVRFYAAPTTLLGMVDAALGGKTGVNLPEGKNLAGAFWPAGAVWCDTDTLATLPAHEFRAGAAEVFKHGLLARPDLLDAVLPSAHAPCGLSPDTPELAEVVRQAAAVKAAVVAADPTEQGERAFLNLGHTLAHALEAATHHALPHGEAVGYGLHFAALLSEAAGAAPGSLTRYTRAFLDWQQPRPLPPLDWATLHPYIARDKKGDDRGPRWVLLRELGQPYLTHVSPELLQGAFGQWQAAVRRG